MSNVIQIIITNEYKNIDCIYNNHHGNTTNK